MRMGGESVERFEGDPRSAGVFLIGFETPITNCEMHLTRSTLVLYAYVHRCLMSFEFVDQRTPSVCNAVSLAVSWICFQCR